MWILMLVLRASVWYAQIIKSLGPGSEWNLVNWALVPSSVPHLLTDFKWMTEQLSVNGIKNKVNQIFQLKKKIGPAKSYLEFTDFIREMEWNYSHIDILNRNSIS